MEVVPILQMDCATGGTACHGDPSVLTMGGISGGNREYFGPPSGTYMASDISTVLAGIVNKDSVEDPSMPVVTPGNTSKSYMWYKLNNMQSTLAASCSASGLSPACGTEMPNGVTLPQSDLTIIENWITQGAKNN
jgi:hypothetical protein